VFKPKANSKGQNFVDDYSPEALCACWKGDHFMYGMRFGM
jgi:hypothetical protein